MLTRSLGAGECLRLFEEQDAEELYALVVANRQYLSRWMPWAPEQTAEGSLDFIRASRRQVGENQGAQLAIVRHESIVGVIGYHRIDWVSRSTTIGYWIAESAQGLGTVTRSVEVLTDHALVSWQLNRVEIRAGTENRRSRAIPERLGFVREGVLRQAERIGQRYVDHVVYSMLAADWKQPASTGGSRRDPTPRS